MYILENLHMTDSMGPGKLVRHVQVFYVIALGTSFDRYKSQNSKGI